MSLLFVATMLSLLSTYRSQPPALHVSQLDIARQTIISNPNHPCKNETAVLGAFVDVGKLAGNVSTDMFFDFARRTPRGRESRAETALAAADP